MSWDAVLIAGPTASGKSGLALGLARETGGAVVNADSMQVYRELRVLTARPSREDEAAASHRLYGHVAATTPYSVGRYVEDAEAALAHLKAGQRLPIFVGGTGLYFNALTQGLSPIPPVPMETRSALTARLETIGMEAFFAEFAAADPETAAGLRPTDRQRVLRAASVLAATGTPLKNWQKVAGRPLLTPERCLRVVLAPERYTLHARIWARLKLMLEGGALEEVRALSDIDPALPAARALGVRQLRAVIGGEMRLEEAESSIAMETRRYAKRQMTWFRGSMADWKWLEAPDLRNIISYMAKNPA